MQIKEVLVQLEGENGFSDKAFHFKTNYEDLKEGDYVVVGDLEKRALGKVKAYSVLTGIARQWVLTTIGEGFRVEQLEMELEEE